MFFNIWESEVETSQHSITNKLPTWSFCSFCHDVMFWYAAGQVLNIHWEQTVYIRTTLKYKTATI